MNKNILNYIEECEAWKVGIKNLHWSADNLSQHELCDDIADEISNFEDLVSEVEQSISGKIKLNGFTPKSYKITSLKSFVEDVISASQSFLKELEGMGEKYVGIKSECETFIGTMQRKLYLVNFTLKEELKKRLRDKINESRPINMANATDSRTFMGRKPNRIIEGYRKEENIKTVFPGTKPSSDGGILKRLDAISSGKNGQFNSRTFDSMEDAFDFFKRNLEKVGDLVYGGNVGDVTVVNLNAENGKSYNGMIDFVELDNGKYKASIKFSNLGKESEFNEDFENNDYNDLRMENNEIRLTEDDFMHRWFDRNEEDHLDKVRKQIRDKDQKKLNPFRSMSYNGRVEEGISKNNQIRLTEAELKQVVREAAIKIIESMPTKDREKRLQNQMSWRDFENQELDNEKLNDLIDKGAAYQRQTRNMHKENPEAWKSMTRESIEIKPENKGKFTATKKATGKSTEELTHSKNPLTRKRAIFAQNAKKWSHKK